MIVTLKDITTKITKGTTPTSIGCKFEKSGINFIKSESLVDGKTIDKSKFAFISERTHERLKRSQIEENDILFSMAGMFLGKTGIATAEVVPANTNQAVAIIRVDDTKANYEYVYYYLNQKSVIHTINTTSAQSAQPNINLKQIGKIKINLPNRKKQDQIVSLLSAIDLKISNNVEINDNLFAQMQALYAAWFIDCIPFGGIKPSSWQKTSIYTLVFVLKKLRVEANSEAERYTILTVTEEKTVTSEFLLSYILPLFAFDFTQWKSVALFLIFFLTLGFLCVKHETFTVNIVLEVFGYQFYRCDLEDEDGNGITWMIISRTDLKGCVGDSVYLRPLNNECRLNASTR